MFESFRDKIYTVQQDLSLSLKNLTTRDVSNRRTTRKNYKCNPNAGAELLQKYQDQWKALHAIAEENAQKADEVDKFIGNICHSCEKQSDSIGSFIQSLHQLPKLNDSLQTLMHQIGKLENHFEEVEIALLKLDDIIETQALQEQQLDQRFRLALYKERKLSDLEQLKVQLATKHAQRVQSYEVRHQIVLKERQEAFKEAFEEEMQHYKIHGHIERIPSNASERSVPLEDIQLDEDPAALDEFLAEEATEDIMRQYAIAEAMADEDPKQVDSDS